MPVFWADAYAWAKGIRADGVEIGEFDLSLGQLLVLEGIELNNCGRGKGGSDICVGLKQQFAAVGIGSFSGLTVSQDGNGVLTLNGAISNTNDPIFITFGSNGEVESFEIDGEDIFDTVDNETRKLLSLVAEYGKVHGIRGILGGGEATNGVPLPISFSYEYVDGVRQTTVKFDLGILEGKTGLRSSITRKENGQVVKITARDQEGFGPLTERTEVFSENTTLVTDENGITSLRVKDSPIGFDFADAGSILGSILGRRIAGDNELVGILTSATLKTIGANLGDILNNAIFSEKGQSSPVGKLLEGFETELGQNFLNAGIGAVSSFLTAQLISVVGLDGFSAELANTAAGAVIGQIVTNLTRLGTQIPGAANGTFFTVGDRCRYITCWQCSRVLHRRQTGAGSCTIWLYRRANWFVGWFVVGHNSRRKIAGGHIRFPWCCWRAGWRGHWRFSWLHYRRSHRLALWRHPSFWCRCIVG